MQTTSPNLSRIVSYLVDQEVNGLGRVRGSVKIHDTPDPKLKLTLCKLESITIVQKINRRHIPGSTNYHERLELWLNCDSKNLNFLYGATKGFVDDDSYKTYLAFAYDSLRKAVELEKEKNKKF